MKEEEKLKALNSILHHCRASAFYRQRIPELPINSLEDFKSIPLMTKDDIRSQSPFGLVCIPRHKLYQYHETFGTTGTPASSWFSFKDLQNVARSLAAWGVNFNKQDTVLIRFPYAISSAAHFVHLAAQARKASVVPVSSRTTVSPFTRVIELMRKLEVTVLAGLPLQVLLIAETAEILGLDPKRDFPHLRAIATAGEPHPPKRRELLEQIWNVPVYDHYGMTECGPVGVHCYYKRSHVAEDKHYIEILDDDLQSDAKPGEYGNLVITTLKREATPMLRYLTGDRARILAEPCPCGEELHLEIRGRREDTIVTKSRVFDRWDLEELVSHFPCRRFWVAGPAEDGIQLVIEKERDSDMIAPELVQELEKQYAISLKVELVPRGTLYDRSELLDIGVVGKPRYIYTAAEMQARAYVGSNKL
ncbi:MAG: phenylacetate--CoA ligase family protein [Syntrophomonadaceae bacterium]|jgi:phenylacetate-CoA ligase